MKPVKVLTIIGARPQIIKAAAISRAIKNNFANKITEVLVHTGQHYDDNMSKVFFDELQIPQPDYNLSIGSGTHAKQTAMMLDAIGELLLSEKPDAIILYGDTNSTLAASVAGSKIHIPIIHIEGGLRSFNKIYPEEINRIITDHVSTLIFTPTVDGFNNLIKEGFNKDNNSPYTISNPGIYHCGDIMYDNSLYFSRIAESKTTVLNDHNLKKDNFVLVTIHRDTNTDNIVRLNSIFSAIYDISKKNEIDFLIPLHPRTSKILEKNLDPQLFANIKASKKIKLISPVSFLEIIELEKNCCMVMTDSGGLQKEAYFFKRPSVIFLAETPWVELISSGSARLVDADQDKIVNAFNFFKDKNDLNFPEYYGNGAASEFICNEIIKNFSK